MASAADRKRIPDPIRGESDELGLRRVSEFLLEAYNPDIQSLSVRLGVFPSEGEVRRAQYLYDRVREQADQPEAWEALNRRLLPFLEGREEPPVGYVAPPRAAPPQRKRYSQGRAASAKLYQTLQRQADLLLAGRLRNEWYNLPTMRRKEMVEEAISLALSSAKGRLEMVTREMLRESVNALRRGSYRREYEQSRREGGYIGGPGSDPGASTESRTEMLLPGEEVPEETAPITDVDVNRKLVEMEARGGADNVRAALVSFHVGRRAAKDQPQKFLLPSLMADTAYHHSRETRMSGASCPICTSISRYLNIKGLTPDRVRDEVDGFFHRLSEED